MQLSEIFFCLIFLELKLFDSLKEQRLTVKFGIIHWELMKPVASKKKL